MRSTRVLLGGISTILCVALLFSGPVRAQGRVTIGWGTFPLWWSGITGKESSEELQRLREAGEPSTWFEMIMARFSAKHPNVSFEHMTMGWGDAEKLVVSLVAGSGPDVFYVFPAFYEQLADGELIHPIDPYLAHARWDEFHPVARSYSLYKGKHYLWPWFIVAEGTWLANKTMFDEAGLTHLLPRAEEDYHWTLDEFLAAATAIRIRDPENPRYATNVLNVLEPGGVYAWRAWSFLYGHDGFFWDLETGTVTQRIRDAVKATYDLFQRMAEDELDGPASFPAGRLAIQAGGGSQLYRQLVAQYGSAAGAPFEFVLINPPAIAPNIGVIRGGVGGWVVNRNTTGERLDWAMRFAQFLTEDEQQLTIAFGLPARTTAIQEYVERDEVARFEAMYAMNRIVLDPSHAQATRILSLWSEAGLNVVRHRWGPELAAEEYQRGANLLLSEP